MVFCLHICLPCPVSPEEVIRSLRTRTPHGCEPWECWGSKPGSWEEQPVLSQPSNSWASSLKVFGSAVYRVNSRKDKDLTLNSGSSEVAGNCVKAWGQKPDWSEMNRKCKQVAWTPMLEKLVCRENTPPLLCSSNEVHNEGGSAKAGICGGPRTRLQFNSSGSIFSTASKLLAKSSVDCRDKVLLQHLVSFLPHTLPSGLQLFLSCRSDSIHQVAHCLSLGMNRTQGWGLSRVSVKTMGQSNSCCSWVGSKSCLHLTPSKHFQMIWLRWIKMSE